METSRGSLSMNVVTGAGVQHPSRATGYAGGVPQGACDLWPARIRRGRRIDELRGEHYRRAAPGRHLCRPDSQGREARRSPGHAVDQVRVRDQPQYRQGIRPQLPTRATRDRRRGDRVKRREFITLLGGAVGTWLLAASAQQPERMRKVGLLMGRESAPDARASVKALRQRLGELGWSEDRNIRIDVVWGAGDADHVRADAAELIRESPDLIVTEGPVPTIEAGKATPAIPIVFVQVPDPVDLGIVASLARPGRNITGFTHFELAFAGKWLETLKDMAPQTRRVLLVTLAEHPALPGFLRTIVALESSSGVKATPAGVRHAAEIERAIDDFTREPNGGLIVLPSQIATTHRELIIALAARTVCRRSTHGAIFPNRAACRPTGSTPSICSGVRPLTLIAFSGARSQLTFRCRRQRNTSLSSISRPRRRSVLKCRQRCSPAPMR